MGSQAGCATGDSENSLHQVQTAGRGLFHHASPGDSRSPERLGDHSYQKALEPAERDGIGPRLPVRTCITAADSPSVPLDNVNLH